ncbi:MULTISPECIES: response regulator transcription factor [Azospirillum]|jgi:Response regulator|uniref:Response regulator n=1 Tax=Azospirillum brasilense TaxID=192 RepID=A0ABU4PCH2_AZOBR|nr:MULTISPECIES: response regulator [Azospirillum]PWC72901.1 transcriptional regulator [Azospirillum sp. TSH58]PWC85619.1 transcriptional regulator [Azospirillum sp. Sp 7]MBB3264491.1 two-component system response regulator FixJ [Azospirillum sp. OGB3]MDW7553244.1 response regulator [Azospirillum brasilense]MDW7593377.1 response regulator [Azospirillum brasilense]
MLEAVLAEPGDSIVYIVDDDEPVRDSMKALLEACAFEVRDYASCQSFMDQYNGKPSGCLVLDLHLPVMSGLEFIERFGANLHGLPVIMVSGRGDPATFARAREAGVTAFLEKPFEEDQLLDAVQRLLPA